MKKIILTVITTTLLFANATEETKVQAQVAETKTEVKAVIEKAQKDVTKAQAKVKMKTQADKGMSYTGARLEVKQSKREAELEALLAKKELERNDKAKIREEKLKKLDADLKAKADKRAGLVY